MRKRKGAMILAILLSLCLVFAGCHSSDLGSGDILPPTASDLPSETPSPSPSPDQTPIPTPTPTPPSPPTPPTPQKQYQSYVRAVADGVNVRSGAGSTYSVVGQLDKGDMVMYVSLSNGWYKITFRGKTAYVSAREDLTEIFKLEKSDNDIIEKTLKIGYELLGTPYVYGAVRLHDGSGRLLSGFTKTKFDCSSLTQYMLYYGAGKNLQTTTRTQVKQGTKIEKSKLARGDLMFFTNDDRVNNSGIERIGHVAIYLGGNYILHTSSDHAVIEEISAKRWSYLIEIRRMIA